MTSTARRRISLAKRHVSIPLPIAMSSTPPYPAAAPPAPYSDASFIAVATPRTRALRTFVPWQLWRFVVINLRMLRMISRSHH